MAKKQVKVTDTIAAKPKRNRSTKPSPDAMVEVLPKREPVTRRAPSRVELEDLPHLAEQICGWSPRITIYLHDPAELKKYMGDRHFSAQNPIVPQYTIGQYNLREVGAWKEERDPRSAEVPSDKRIVEVTLKRN